MADVPVRTLIRESAIESLSTDEGEALRVELSLTGRTEPGFVFSAISTGRIASYLGATHFFEVGE